MTRRQHDATEAAEPYEPPRIRVLGTVLEVTLGATGLLTDALLSGSV